MAGPQYTAEDIRRAAMAVRRKYEDGEDGRAIALAYPDFFAKYPLLCKVLVSESYNHEYFEFLLEMMAQVRPGDEQSYSTVSESVGKFFTEEYVAPLVRDKPPPT